MTKKKTSKLKGAHLKPFYILKIGDLVRVKDWELQYPGMLGIVLEKSTYGVACEVMLSTGQKRTMMNYVLERVDKDE